MKRTTTVKSKKPAVSKKTAKSVAAKPKSEAAKTCPEATKSRPEVKSRPELQVFVHALLDADKAQEIVLIPLKGKTTIADYMLIATGTSSRHVSSMAKNLRDRLSTDRKIKARLEGLETGDWAIIDAGDVMVHLFRKEVRNFYDLEKLWGADFGTVHYTRYQSV